MRFAALLVFLASCAPAAEYAVLSSGARLHIDRHEVTGDRVRLIMGDSSAEMKAADVLRYEPEDYIPPVPAPAAPQLAAAAPPAAEPQPGVVPTPQDLADQAADKYGLPRWLVRSVM